MPTKKSSQKNKKTLIIILIILIAAIIGILGFYFWPQISGFGAGLLNKLAWGRATKTESVKPEEFIGAKEAYDLALAEAGRWQEDALLVSLGAKEIGDDGKAREWQAEFHSKKEAKVNYSVIINNNKVLKAETISSALPGGEVKKSWLRSDLAIRQAKATRKDLTVESLVLFYDPGFKLWFWSAKTSQGVVTMEVK